MNVSKLAPYAKAVVAGAGAVGITAVALSDGIFTADEVVQVLTAWFTTIGVYQVKNREV